MYGALSSVPVVDGMVTETLMAVLMVVINTSVPVALQKVA